MGNGEGNYPTSQEARRLMDGDNPVGVWRDKRGMTQSALAEAANLGVSYLSEIEGGKKSGGVAADRGGAGRADGASACAEGRGASGAAGESRTCLSALGRRGRYDDQELRRLI